MDFRNKNKVKTEIIKKAKGVTMLALVVTIIVLLILAAITLNLAVGENGIIERAKLARDKVKNASIAEDEEINKVVEEINSSKNESGSGEGGTCPDVSELEETIKRLQETIANLEQQLENERLNKEELEKQIAEMNKQIEELNRQIEVLKAKQAIGNATVSDVLAGKTFSNSSGVGLVGTMANNGAINANLNAGQSHTIPAGYTEGGTITANSLDVQTPGTAIPADIQEGKTAWVNGQKLTGTEKVISTLNDCKTEFVYDAAFHGADSKIGVTCPKGKSIFIVEGTSPVNGGMQFLGLSVEPTKVIEQSSGFIEGFCIWGMYILDLPEETRVTMTIKNNAIGKMFKAQAYCVY